MVTTRKKYSREFKLDALRLARESGKSITELERDLGLGDGTLFHWRLQLERRGAEAFPGNGNLPPTEARLRELERENGILREERDILKKAIAVLTPRRA
jgi:transposase